MDGSELNEKANSDLDFLKEVHVAWYDLTIIRKLHIYTGATLQFVKGPNSVPPSEWARKIHLNPSQWDAGGDHLAPCDLLKIILS